MRDIIERPITSPIDSETNNATVNGNDLTCHVMLGGQSDGGKDSSNGDDNNDGGSPIKVVQLGGIHMLSNLMQRHMLAMLWPCSA